MWCGVYNGGSDAFCQHIFDLYVFNTGVTLYRLFLWVRTDVCFEVEGFGKRLSARIHPAVVRFCCVVHFVFWTPVPLHHGPVVVSSFSEEM